MEVGRLTYLTKTVSLRPYLGARGGTIHQKFKSLFSSPLGEMYQPSFNSWAKTTIGVWDRRLGFNGEWHMNRSFSLLGKLSGALLDGQMQVSTLTTDFQNFDNFYQLSPNLDLLLGIQWQTCFWCDKMFFKMSLGWETDFWWNQFNLPTSLTGFTAPLPTTGSQSLTLEGVNFTAEWDF